MAETGNQRDLTKGEKTKYRLARAMKECMKTTSVENITVKQITEKCELTRQTFYRNFLDKYDLINWYFDKLLAKSFEHMGQGKTVYDALVKKFTYIQEEQKFFSAAFRYDEQNSLRQHDFELILAFYEKLICEKTGKFPEENVLPELYLYDCQMGDRGGDMYIGRACRKTCGRYAGETCRSIYGSWNSELISAKMLEIKEIWTIYVFRLKIIW